MFNLYSNDIFLFADNARLSNYAGYATILLIQLEKITTLPEIFKIKMFYFYKNGFMGITWF